MSATPVQAPALMENQHGILKTVNVIKPGDERWNKDGVSFTPAGCETIFAHERDCWVDGTALKGVQEWQKPITHRAYTLELTMTAMLGNTMPSDSNSDPEMEAALKSFVDVGASSVIERLLELGIVNTADIQAIIPIATTTISLTGVVGKSDGNGPSFAAAVDVGDSASGKEAMARVEQKLLDSSDHIAGAGTLYMGPLMAATAFDLFRLGDDDVLRSKLTGSKIVIGNFGAASVWGHCGEMDLYCTDPITSSSMLVDNGADNMMVSQVEMSIAPAWNVCTLVRSDVVVAP